MVTMSLRFAKITQENVDDLMSVCGNAPGMSKHPAYVEGRKARRQWLLDMIEKFGTVGMLAYSDSGSARGFVECIPASAHPMGVFSPDVKRTAVIDCAWYAQSNGEPGGLAVRKAILDEMFSVKFFDKLLGKKCRYVDVLTLKNAPIMQYDFYRDYGFRDAVEFTGHATGRYLLRYPVLGDTVEARTEQLSFNCGADKNVLIIGTYDQCHLPRMVVEKIRKAVDDMEGLKIKVVDYWETGTPAVCEASINGMPAFGGPVYFMDDEGIREAVASKMLKI
jgi:hypothetical protein